MSNPLLSVIVPVYNVEKYLNKCVESIVNQSYENLEIILVDDGSNDASRQICDDLASADNRIVVIHKSNGGVSSARNVGIDAARGKYIAFVDADDYIEKDMYKTMLTKLEESQADIVACEYCIEYDEGADHSITEDNHLREEVLVKGPEVLHQLAVRDFLTIVLWNKVYKRELFDTVEFPEGRVHEEIFVFHEILYGCQSILYIPEQFYHYIQRPKSIMQTDKELSQLLDVVAGYHERIQFLEDKDSTATEDAVRMLYEYCRWKYDTFLRTSNKEGSRVMLKELKNSVENYRRILEPDTGIAFVIEHNKKYSFSMKLNTLKARVKNGN